MSSAENVIGLYERHAGAWDRKRNHGGKLMERGWLDRFCGLVPPGGAVLDLGCGSGRPLASEMIARGFGVTGVDSSAAMIALCEARHPAHEWHVADMRGLDLGRRFDGILAWDSFFHLRREDQRAMFPVFARHAAAGSALMFTSGPSDGEALGSFEGEELYHSSLAPDEYRALLAAQGYEVEAHLAEDPDCGGHTVWLARQS
ncbi:class I SAM-dependent DNA methyltransferase [Roseococcus sp. YIM B11640]|uniref:class I SAM-dependent DNA methyltransferase n=1 Tax=Roseococcus sp. YIM B11640 TaxID=3133973 RepID=UPI003C7D5540